MNLQFIQEPQKKYVCQFLKNNQILFSIKIFIVDTLLKE